MIGDEIKYRIGQAFGFEPTDEQQRAMDVFAEFMTDRDERAVMVLRGSAGTGKTTLAGAIVKAMRSLRGRLVLLAPTDRRRNGRIQPERQSLPRHALCGRRGLDGGQPADAD